MRFCAHSGASKMRCRVHSRSGNNFNCGTAPGKDLSVGTPSL